jgi:hypothetical protein
MLAIAAKTQRIPVRLRALALKEGNVRHKLYYVSASVLFSAVAFFMYDWIAALNPNAEWAQAYPSVAGLYVDIPGIVMCGLLAIACFTNSADV